MIIAMFIATVAATSAVSTASAQQQIKYGVRAGFNNSTYRIGIKDASFSVNPGSKAGIYLGGQAIIPIQGVWSFQPELVYSMGGLKISGKGEQLELLEMGLDGATGTLSISSTMHHLNIPLLVRMQASDKLSLMAGPYIAYRMALGVDYNDGMENFMKEGAMDEELMLEEIANAKKSLKTTLDENLSKLDIGFTIGAEYAFDNGLFVDMRYNFGLINHLKSDYKIVMDGETVEEGSWKKDMGVEPKMKRSSFQIGVGYRF